MPDHTAHLPAEKLMALQELIQSWRTRQWCNRHQLESLIGHLHLAAKVVWLGGTLLWRMLDLLCCFRTRNHPICLSSEFQLNLHWWHDFLTSWHGLSLQLFPGMSAPIYVEVTTDVAGSLGFGAYYNDEWFSGAWVPSQYLHFFCHYTELIYQTFLKVGRQNCNNVFQPKKMNSCLHLFILGGSCSSWSEQM